MTSGALNFHVSTLAFRVASGSGGCSTATLLPSASRGMRQGARESNAVRLQPRGHEPSIAEWERQLSAISLVSAWDDDTCHTQRVMWPHVKRH